MTLEIHMELLKKFADEMERRFLSPVYLVGSFERDYRDAGDIDLIMVMSDSRMIRNFGTLEYTDRRFAFNRKQKLYAEQFVTDFDIDFKVQTEKQFKAHDGNKTKLGKYVAFPE